MNNQQITCLKKVLQYVKHYWTAMLVSVILAACQVVMALAIPVLAGKAIDCIVAAGQVDFEALGRFLLGILACAGISALSQWGMTEVNNRVTYHVARDIRIRAFSQLQNLPISYLDSHPHGDLVSRIISDVDTFSDGLLMGFSQLFTGVLTIIGTLVIMLSISWQIALVVLCVTPLSLLVARFIARKTYVMFELQSRIRGEETAIMNETITQLKVVKAFGHEQESLQKFDSVNQKLEKASLKATFFSSLTNPCTRFVNSVVYAGVGLTGALAAISGTITVGNLTSFLSYANQYTKPFNEISGVITELQNALACAGRVFELMELPTEQQDDLSQTNNITFNGDIWFNEVFFSYHPEHSLIEHFSFHAAPGQKVAIVGPTGCGKTTLINLLMRFYEPQKGNINLDRKDISLIPRQVIRKNIGMVLQDTWLMNGSIKENIAMGKPDASDAEIIHAAKLAHAHHFIKQLSQGYDTKIGEAGAKLSQGQRQLLCIARVMLCMPPMLILDEATSSIDTRTEMKIQQAFSTLMQGRTSLVVAHRLSTIQEADLILVMDHGHITELGTHEELLKKNGLYHQLYYSQFAH